VQAVVARLGIDPVTPANPYWSEHGVTFEDPTGSRSCSCPRSGGPRRELRRGSARACSAARARGSS
jgi:hypothetical protein